MSYLQKEAALEAETKAAVTKARELFAPLVPNERPFIGVARELLKPEKVKLHAFPGWLSKRLRAYQKARHADARLSHTCLFNSVASHVRECLGLRRDNCYDLLDHWGTIVGGPWCCCQGKVCFVSEPYGFSVDGLRVWEGLAKAIDCYSHISANSWWNPPYTLRAILHERDAE